MYRVLEESRNKSQKLLRTPMAMLQRRQSSICLTTVIIIIRQSRTRTAKLIHQSKSDKTTEIEKRFNDN